MQVLAGGLLLGGLGPTVDWLRWLVGWLAAVVGCSCAPEAMASWGYPWLARGRLGLAGVSWVLAKAG